MRAELLGSLTGKSEKILPYLPGHQPPASSPEYSSTGIFARFRKIIPGENPVLLATVGGFSGPSQSPEQSMVAHACPPSTQVRQEEHNKFKASLDYIESSRLARLYKL